MPLIEARALTKEFRVFRRRDGAGGAFLDLSRRRCEALRAVDAIGRPEINFLDEPTIGLDLVAKEGIRRFLLKENRERAPPSSSPPTTSPTSRSCASG